MSFRKPEVTSDVSDSEKEDIIIKVAANFKVDLATRYEQAVKRLIRRINTIGVDDYILVPVLLAKDVDSSVLEEIPSRIFGYRVHCAVLSGRLFITNLSIGPPHANAVGAFNQQARNWNSENFFDIYSDGVSNFGEEASGAPDMVLTVPAVFRRVGGGPRRSVVVVELEISNRTISQMRADYLKYFDDDALLGVIGIKFFGVSTCPVQRGAAVQWVRAAGGGIQVAAVRDFGVEPMTATAKRFFAQYQPDSLPGVPPEAWADNRHVPLTPESMNPPPPGGVLTADAAGVWIRNQRNERGLYAPSTAPVLTFRGVDLAARLHNLPPGAVVNDLVVDLAHVLFHTMRGAAYQV